MLPALAALLVTIGVMLLALRWLGRLHGMSATSHRGGSLQLLERIATGPRQAIGLVRVGERVLVVGLADEISLLGEVDEATRQRLVVPQSSAPGDVMQAMDSVRQRDSRSRDSSRDRESR